MGAHDEGFPVVDEVRVDGERRLVLQPGEEVDVASLADDLDGIGLGDAKFLAAAGAWVGWQSLPSLVLIAACTAIVLILLTRVGKSGDLNRRLPFGPHLALAAWVTLLYQPLI